MGNKQKFFSQLQKLYIGAKLDGKGGMANLLQFKCQYFEHIKPLIEAEIKKSFPDAGDSNLPELYEKLYTFFSSYLTDGGSIYFSDTPAYKNVYAKVYFDKEDTALFYKTKDLYYVKSQIMYQSVENLTFTHENKSIGVYFDFDATNYIPTNNNTKEKVLILSLIHI
jgi:adenine-specific DNA-methyltransferase